MHGRKVINNKVDSILRRVDVGKDIVIIPSAVIFEIGYLMVNLRESLKKWDAREAWFNSFMTSVGMDSSRPTQRVWVTLQTPAHFSEYLKRAR